MATISLFHCEIYQKFIEPARSALLALAVPNSERPLLFITHEALSICKVLWNHFLLVTQHS